MDKKSTNSAVLDVVIENKDISNILKEVEDNDPLSLCSNLTVENSSVTHSPSLESFSTLRDTEVLSELHTDENSDFCVTVDGPQKNLDMLETYITYRITTKVARIEFSENEYVVRRRYNEFSWLYHKLIECHPFCIVPPLPSKHTLIGQLDRYSKDFIYARMKLLNTFMNRIVQHPILSCNQHLKLFLTANQPNFTLHRKHRTNACNKVSLASNGVSYVSSNVRHLEFEKIKDYLNTLSEKLVSIEKISSRINKERHEYVEELRVFYPVLHSWSTHETQLEPLLQSMGNAFEKCTFALSFMISNYSNLVTNPVKEFLLYVDCVKETLHKREVYQNVFEHSLQELNKRRNEKDKLLTSQNTSHSSGSFLLWKQQQPNSDDKLEKLGAHIPQLVKKVEINRDNLECANESLRSDLDRWQDEKQKCLKKILLDFANKQIEFYEKSIISWENVAANLSAQKVHLKSARK